ncbi:MLKL protein, partial [Nothoprocta pentlandii]|nr:MLKL protein [Nothoprocta pentlandii]
MDIVEKVFLVAQSISAQLEQVKCCKHQCQRLVERIRTLLEPVRVLRAQPAARLSCHEEQLLSKLLRALADAHGLVAKYSQASWIQKFLCAHSSSEEFARVNESLGDVAQGLSLLLQAEQKQVLLEAFQAKTCRWQDAEDLCNDRAFVDEVIASNAAQPTPCCLGGAGLKKADVDKREDITEIQREQLTFRRHLQDTESYDLYEGEYLKYPVAIKTFKRPLTTDSVKVRDIFEKEVRTLKKFESPNILRMYGICIEERDGNPCFSIVMEYCEHGTLREVLSKQQLSWDMRLRMALGAARGLYRLHQTEKKSRLHGCINSSKFLVAGDYCVKLSGFELCETETSIKRKVKKKNWNKVSTLAYVAPENLQDICYPYKRPYEIYSFGIVLWEIATSKIPFEAGCTPQEIREKICEHHYQEPLGEDCPEGLRKTIEQCRAFEPSQRPSAERKCPRPGSAPT